MSKPKFKSLLSHDFKLIILGKRFSIYTENCLFLINFIFPTKAMVRKYLYFVCVCVGGCYISLKHFIGIIMAVETIEYDLYSTLKETEVPGLLWKGSFQPVCNLLPIHHGGITSQTCTGRHSFSHRHWHCPGYASHL